MSNISAPRLDLQSEYAHGLKFLIHADAGFVDLVMPTRGLTVNDVLLAAGDHGQEFTSGATSSEITLSPGISLPTNNFTVATFSNVGQFSGTVWKHCTESGAGDIQMLRQGSTDNVACYDGATRTLFTVTTEWAGLANTQDEGVAGRAALNGEVGYSWSGVGIVGDISCVLGSTAFTFREWVDARWLAVWDWGIPDDWLRDLTHEDGRGIELLFEDEDDVIHLIGGGINIASPKGTLTLTGFAPAISTGIQVGVPVGTLALTGLAPSIPDTSLDIPVGTLSLTGFAPTLATADISVPNGTLTLTGFAPTITAASGATIDVPVGSLTLTGNAPSIVTKKAGGAKKKKHEPLSFVFEQPPKPEVAPATPWPPVQEDAVQLESSSRRRDDGAPSSSSAGSPAGLSPTAVVQPIAVKPIARPAEQDDDEALLLLLAA